VLVSAIEEKLKNITEELESQSDRGAAIIAAAIVDNFLADAIQTRLILTADVKDRLFGGEANGPLAHFAAKIDIGFAIGILNDPMWSDLHDVRRIRNRFAHTPEPLTFDDSKISARCLALRTLSGLASGTKGPRHRYIAVCSGMATNFAALRDAKIRLGDVRDISGVKAEVFEAVSKMLDRFVEQFDESMRNT
jgi:DNA-binding MltR family transcriptional regulator